MLAQGKGSVHTLWYKQSSQGRLKCSTGRNSLYLALGFSLPSKALEEAPRHHFLTAQQSHLFSGAKAVPLPPALQLFSLLFIPGRL